MTGVRVIDDGAGEWRAGFASRLRQWYLEVGYPPAAADGRVVAITRQGETAEASTAATIQVDGAPAGHVSAYWFSHDGVIDGRIEDIWVSPDHRGHGAGAAARSWAEQWFAGQGVSRVGASLTRPTSLFDHYHFRAQTMVKRLESRPVLPDGLVSRAMDGTDFPGWLEAQMEGYVSDIVRSGSMTPEEARTKSDADIARLLPEGLATPEHSFWLLETEGGPVASIWLKHDATTGASYIYSLEVDPQERGRGYGRAIVLLGEQATLAAGDTALALNVFAGNDTAIHVYSALGYRVADQFRSLDRSRRGAATASRSA